MNKFYVIGVQNAYGYSVLSDFLYVDLELAKDKATKLNYPHAPFSSVVVVEWPNGKILKLNKIPAVNLDEPEFLRNKWEEIE